MEQRRGRKFTRQCIILGFCKHVVADGLSDTGAAQKSRQKLYKLFVGFCEHFVADGLSDTGWNFGTDLDIGTDLFIDTGWTCGTDLVIGSGFIIGAVGTFVKLFIVDSGSRKAVHRRH